MNPREGGADDPARHNPRPDGPPPDRDRAPDGPPDRPGPDDSAAHRSAGDGDAPDSPGELRPRSWKSVLRRTGKEFKEDDLQDRAAALTYYGVLSIFPALLVLVSLLGLLGASATQKVLDNLQRLAPGSVRDIIGDAVTQLQNTGGTSGVIAVVGLLGALWSASGYIAAFIRTSNAVYDLPEGRPSWKVTPLRLALTVALTVLLAASAVIVVFTGPLAQRVGRTIGLGDTALTVWSIAKWPVLVLLVVLMIALLYWAAPNVRGRGFRWVTPGSLVAVLVWLLASAAFAFYVANFASYNKTYGTLAGVIIFLVWLWLSNLAILLGLELDAELARERALAAGHPGSEEPYVEPRDTRKWPRGERHRRHGRHGQPPRTSARS